MKAYVLVFDFLIFHLLFDGALVGGYKNFGGMCFASPIDEVKSCHELRPRSLPCPESMKKTLIRRVGDW